MVVWTEIQECIRNNPYALHNVELLQCIDPRSSIDVFPIFVSPKIVPKIVQNEVSFVPKEDIQHIPESVQSSSLFPTELSPVIDPVRSVEKSVILKTYGKEIDPLVIDLAETIELYEGSSYQSRKQIECEEALRIEAKLNEMYKTQSGRSRGWTKAGLEALLQPRCASGGDIRELSKCNSALAWQLVGIDKVYSSFLDFLCVTKQIRIAVWFQEEKQVIVFPAGDYVGPEKKERAIPLYNVSSKGLIIKDIHTCKQLIDFCVSNNWTMMSPLSVFHSLSLLTLQELESVGEKLGIANMNGSKKERVAKLVSHKLRQRLLPV